MKLYTSFYYWKRKPDQNPKGMSNKDYSEMPPIIGPLLGSMEIDGVPPLDSLRPLEEQLLGETQAVRVVIISVIELPIGPTIAVPQLAIPGRML